MAAAVPDVQLDAIVENFMKRFNVSFLVAVLKFSTCISFRRKYIYIHELQYCIHVFFMNYFNFFVLIRLEL